jgi:probable HAF family extracellular repeat protein
MTDLGTLSGGTSSATAINASGQIVGYASTTGLDSHAFLYSGGSMIDLGTLGGSGSTANAIDASGQIVGDAYTTSGAERPFLYSGGSMSDLNSITDLSGTNFSYLSSARGISDTGYIVGWGVTTGGQTNAYLLSPTGSSPPLSAVPEPSTYAAIFAGALLGLAGWRWQQRRGVNSAQAG